MTGGRPFDIRPAGMLALDVARVEAGLLLIDVDFHSSQKALIESQMYSPFEMGLGRLVELDKGPFVGRAGARRRAARGSTRQIVGLEIDWPAVERLYDAARACRRRFRPTASRVAVPVYKDGRQVGRATTTTWSPVLKKLIALATIDAPHFADGTRARVRDHRRSGAPSACRRPSSRRRSSTRSGRQPRRSDGRLRDSHSSSMNG